MKLINHLFFINFFLLISSLNTYTQVYRVIESDIDHIIIEFNFGKSYTIVDTTVDGKTFQKIRGEDHSLRNPGDPWMPEFKVLAGVPFGSKSTIKMLEQKQSVQKNKFILPYPEEDPALVKQDFEKINKEVYSKNELFPASATILEENYVVRYTNVLPISLVPYQFNPVTRDLVFNSYIKVRIDFNVPNYQNVLSLNDAMSDDFLKTSVVNYPIALNFSGREVSSNAPIQKNSYWYNPNKNYFKVYVKEKDVYRLTFEELSSAGVQFGPNTSIKKLEMFNDGLPVPIQVFDNNTDSIFNQGDYLQFVGYPATATLYCKTNIYNLTNVYWFSHESDSSGVDYKLTHSFSGSYDRSYFANLTTLHFERDSLYERLGYAQDDKRDFWLWDRASSRNGVAEKAFGLYFESFDNWFYPDSPYVRLKIAMQGLLNSGICQVDHKAYVMINEKAVGDISWNGQNDVVFDKRFYASPDSIPIYPGNQLIVEVRGDVCPDDDEIRINWVEFDYWRGNSVFGNNYNFINHDNFGVNRYGIFDWQGSDMRIYIPSKNKMMYLPNTTNYEQFVDTMNAKAEYFLASSDYFSIVDSIVADVPSDLRNTTNGADYIIITHKNFTEIANQLAELRSNNFPDENIPNPRIVIVDVQQIYDEFAYGFLEPKSLKEFVKYAFENWQLPAPSYIVLLGDMSYDYRALLESSRPSFIPSIPYFTNLYGQAASDNLIVAVAGNDAGPDLAIGRLSIETVAEGSILLQKLSDYPDDPTKPWKQNVLLLASGLSLQDELQFGFNDASLILGDSLVTQGFSASYVFRYPNPNNPRHQPFQGEGPKIREEINKGAVLVNYYGHGGGYQWDLVFTNDDIYLLENEGRLPLILSVTCYTAHFDNQDVFGEQFNKVPGKGSIGFYGSSGLTYWGVGTAINREFFSEVFTSRNYITGKAIMNSKNRVPAGGLYGTQINLLTYLGDPVMKLALPNYPDFELKSNDIWLIPENPIVGDSLQVKIKISNWGSIFPNDSVVVELYAELPDTAYQIGMIKRANFGEVDSVYFPWIPDKGGFYTLTAKVNETEIILEEDHSDNIGTAQIIIFNISEPNILTPVDGFVTSSNQVEFTFADIGYYIPKELKYFIQIDTSLNFLSPIFSSGEIIPTKSSARWNSPNLSKGVYFWRARIFDGTDFGNWSPTQSFSIMNQSKNGYYAHENILKTFSLYNINYDETKKSLVLNTTPLPARPSLKTHQGDFLPDPQLTDSLELTTITTDGTYLYFANIWFYARELTDGMSMIYKVGTGNNGTVEGQFYGRLSTFRDTVLHSIVCDGNNLYVAIGDPFKLVRINLSTENIDTFDVHSGILNSDNSKLTKGPQFLTFDGQFIYNIALEDSLGNKKYTIRTFDPINNWSLAKSDTELFGTSAREGFTGFFVHGDRIYTCEYFNNYMRRHRLSDGFFEEEWLVMEPMPSNFKHYFAWCHDWQHDKIYASVFKYADSTVVPKFGKFAGYYVDANGTITTKQVGPVAWWNSLKYDLSNPSPTGEYSTLLLGQNSSTKIWDTLQVNVPDSVSLSVINSELYPNLKIKFDLTDSTFTTTEPMELKSVHFDYHPLSDVYVEREDFNFQQDSLLQGYPVTFDFKARSFGDLSADSLRLNFYLNGLDSLIYNPIVNIPADSFSTPVEYTVDTRDLLFENEISAFGEQRKREYFYFNNLIDQKFFVARDSVRPIFEVKFDGQEIIDNDIVSSTPEVIIKLEDNSPLPLDTSYFTIVHNNKPLRFYEPELSYNYNGPGTPFVITWTPTLPDQSRLLSDPERNTFEVLAKDASGNFFDSTSYRVIFYVYNENDIDQVYNYPNPFARTTHFTFILKGNDKPDELDIKIYTIAGRLIRDIKLTPTDLVTNFNKIYWDGLDEDGDEVGNGVYLYKMIAKFPDKTKTITQKLAKVR